MPNLPPILKHERPWMILILAGYMALAVTYSLITPLFEASDELWHYPMVRTLAKNRLAIPVQDPAHPGPWRQEGGQPPLYYMIGAAATFWIDTSDMDEVRRINPHADIGVVVPDGNANIIAHDADQEQFPWSGTALAVRIVRLISILMGAGTVYFTFRLGSELFPHAPLVALAAAAFTAFNPMFIFISAVINNDNLSTLIAAALLVQIVRLIKRPDAPALRIYGVLGVLAGAGMLAKFQIGFLLPLIALALLILSIRVRDWRPLVIGGAISGGLTILIAGWWYARNYDLYGDATGINVFLDMVGRRAVPADLRQLWTERETFMMSFWGLFGGVNVPMSDDVYRVFNGITAAGIVGLGIGIARLALSRKTASPLGPLSNKVGEGTAAGDSPFSLSSGEKNRGIGVESSGRASPAPTKTENVIGLGLARLIAAIWPVIVFVSLIAWTRQTWASQGRLWFSALAPLNVWLAFGLAQWARRSVRGQAVILIAAAGVFVVLATAAPFTTIRPAYTLDRYATWDDETPESGPQHAACFSEPGADHETLCMAYQTLDGSLRPGDFLKFSPAFTVTGTLSREWSIFIHLVNEDGTIEAQRDVYPGGGLIATSDLEVDDAWNNRIAVELPKGLYTPQTLDVYLGLYHLPTFDRMITAGSGADSLTNRVHLGQIRLETPPGSVPNPVSVNFGDKVKLLGYEITDRSLKPGEATMITLYWRALEKLDAEYVISIQVIDPDPARLNKAAQEDRPPAPSTLEWDEDDMITDNRTLTVVEDAVPGRYRLLVRVYPADDPANPLRVRGSTGAQSEDFVWLSWVQIEP